MEDLIDRITEFASDLPTGLIIFLVAIAFSFFGRDNRQEAAEERQQRVPTPDQEPETVPSSHTFASDERREREERTRQEERARQEVIVFGGLEFGSSDSLFRDEEDRESQWGKTKYGFEEAEWGSDWETEWGSAFSDRKSSEPIIR